LIGRDIAGEDVEAAVRVLGVGALIKPNRVPLAASVSQQRLVYRVDQVRPGLRFRGGSQRVVVPLICPILLTLNTSMGMGLPPLPKQAV
jgi:hypothetical protein